MALTLKVYDRTNTTLQGTLASAYGVRFTDAHNRGGALQFSVDAASTADVNLLSARRVVRVLNGAAELGAYYVHDRPYQLKSPDEVPALTYSCPSLDAWFGPSDHGGAVVYPYGGLTGRLQDPRSFGPWAPDFDASSWASPTSGGSLTTPGWPDPSAEAFTFSSYAAYRRVCVGKSAYTGQPSRMSLVATRATHVRLYYDGELILERHAGDPIAVYSVDLEYDGQDHVIYLECSGGTRVGWSWYRLTVTTDGSGNETVEPGPVLFRTFTPAVYGSAGAPDPWKAREDTAAGGVTPGFVLSTLIDEAQTRGALSGLTYTFTDTLDSDGNAWTASLTHAWPVGTKLLRVLETLAEFGCDFYVDATGELIVVNSRGTDRSGTVTIASEVSHGLTGRGVEMTALLSIAGGGMSESTDTTGVTNYGRIEDAATFGTVDDADDLTAPITDLLTDGAAPFDVHDIALSDASPEPYVDFFLGDTVTLTGRSGSTTGRARRFTCVQDDDTGTLDWAVEIR